MNSSFYELRNSKLGPKVVKALEARHFGAFYAADTSEAADRVFSLIPKDHVISWGGSMTAKAMGLYERAAQEGYRLIDRDKAKNPEEKIDLLRQSLLCDTYLMGTNALSEDGILVNIDGNGNRVAALSYGPKQVIIVAGINKVVKTLDDAVARARNVAAPLNVQRFPSIKTPCNINGACSNCKGTESVCCQFLITRLCNPGGRIKVILIGADLGF
ncbi:MAG: lactate utilization protein [Spirochaetaceae bacterium]|jgi:L-lactate utilization protein LutB|nr:lactate utilization protein [Spirochaetaceae bacterium]